MKVRIGTRRSKLAMWQTNWVAAQIREKRPDVEVEILPIQTLGDRDKATALSAMGRTGVFVKELEDALLENRCDLAVHSFKDMATAQPPGLTVGAVLEREEPNDVLVSRSKKNLADLDSGSVIGTSSLRRRSMLLHNRSDLQVAELRGNVPTRLRAAGVDLDDGKEPSPQDAPDGTIMALAGLKRLGLDAHVTEILPTDKFIPAPAQGVVAVQIRADDEATRSVVEVLEHKPSRLATTAERRFLQVMEGGCHMPLGALATVEGDLIKLDGIVLSLDGTRVVRGYAEGTDPMKVGEALAADIKSRGGDEILAQVAEQTRGE